VKSTKSTKATTVRFTGTTVECFQHLMANSVDQLQTMGYVAEFCQNGKIGTTTVFKWWRGDDFAGGEQMARLRLLLHLGGYNVTEVMDLSGTVRQALFIVGSGLVAHDDLKDNLGYAQGNTYGLWSVLIQGTGYSPKVAEGLEKVVRVNEKRLTAFVRKHGPEIRALIQPPKVELLPPPPPVDLPALSVPSIAAALDSLCRSGSELARGLVETGDIEGILRATNGGVNLKELHQLLGMIVE
jgi:hypothetical protein